MIAVYDGKALSSSLLDFVNASSIQIQSNQLGGLGQFVVGVETEANSAIMANMQIPNMVCAYLYQSVLTTSTSTGSVSINVSHPQCFTEGDTVAIYDGTNYDFVVVESMSGSTIAFTPALTHSYSVGATILKLSYRGMVQQVDRDLSVANLQRITCIGYFQELNSLVLQSGNFAVYEAGYILLNTLLLYTDEIDLVIQPENFTYSPNGLDLTQGTGQAFYANYGAGGTSMSQFITDIIQASNGNSTSDGSDSTSAFSLWVDVNNIVYFQRINETTPTKTYNIQQPTITNESYDGLTGLYDNVANFTSHEDGSNIANVIYAMGGNYSSTQQTPVQTVVIDETSVALYGNKELSVTFDNITDVQTLTSCASGMLNNLAYPTYSYTAVISPIQVLPNISDCFEFTGFTDGSTVIASAQSIMIEWNATEYGQFKVTLQLAQLRPNIQNILQAQQSQAYIATVANTEGQSSNLANNFVVSGIEPSFSGNQFSTTSGIFQSNVGVIQSQENYYTDAYTTHPQNSSTQLQLSLNITGNAYVSLKDSYGNSKTFTYAVGSSSGLDTGGQNAYNGNCTFTYYNSSETSNGTYTWSVQAETINAEWTGTNAWYSYIGGSGLAPYSVSINNTVVELNEFQVPSNTFTIPSSGSFSIAYVFQDVNGVILPTPELILFKGNYTSSYLQTQYCTFFRVTCINGAITTYKDLRNISGVTSSHLVSNPSASNPPQFAQLPSAFTYIGSGSGSYGAETTFTLTVGQLPWLYSVRGYAVVSGAGANASSLSRFDLATQANGVYSAIWSGLSGGVQYDLYVCFLDNKGNESSSLLVGTTASNALVLARANQASMPSGVSPSCTGGSLSNLPNGTGVCVELSGFTLDSLGYTSNNWLSAILLMTKPSGTASSSWTINSEIVPISSGSYTAIWTLNASGTGNDIGIAYQDYAGNVSNVQYLANAGTSNIVHSANSATVLGVVGNDGSNPNTTAGINMVYNSNYAVYTPPTSIVSQFASASRRNDVTSGGVQLYTPNGFSQDFESSGSGEGVMGVILDNTYGSLMIMQDASGGNSHFGCVTDAIPIVGGQAYTFEVDVSFGYGVGSVPSGAQWWFAQLFYEHGATDFSRNSASMIQYSSIVSASTTDPNFSTTVGTITAPSNAGYVRIVLYHGTYGVNWSGQWNLAFRNLAMYKANLDHSLMSPGVQAQINSSGAITNINNVVGTATLPYANHDSSFRNVISSGAQLNVSPAGGVVNNLPYANHAGEVTAVINTGGTYNANLATNQLPYANAPTAITNVISSTSVVNINNTTGQLNYYNSNTAVQTALSSVGVLTGIGCSNYTTGTTGTVSNASSPGSVSASIVIPTVGSWYVEATWNVRVSGAQCSVSTSGLSSVASVGFTQGTLIGTVASVATGITGGGTISFTWSYSENTSGTTYYLYGGLITIKAFRYA